jgi:hypothetical protein
MPAGTSTAQHLTTHRREQRYDPVDGVAITGGEPDQLTAFSGDTRAGHRRLDIAAAGRLDVARQAHRIAG